MTLLFEEYSTGTHNKTISLPEGSSTYVYTLFGDTSVAYQFETVAEHTDTTIYALCLATKSGSVKCSLNAHLKHSHSSANIHIITLYTDESTAQIDGGVMIHPSIIKAEGHLLEENIILGKKVSIKTLPMLDVHSNDVKASHGARIERLNPQQQFYLQSKGLPLDVAKRLMIQGYIDTILSPLEGIEDISVLTSRYLQVLGING